MHSRELQSVSTNCFYDESSKKLEQFGIKTIVKCSSFLKLSSFKRLKVAWWHLKFRDMSIGRDLRRWNFWWRGTFSFCSRQKLLSFERRADTRFLRMRLLKAVAYSTKLVWLGQTNINSVKTQKHVVNERWNRVSQLGFNNELPHALFACVSCTGFRSNYLGLRKPIYFENMT